MQASNAIEEQDATAALKQHLCRLAGEAGFVRPRILAPFEPEQYIPASRLSPHHHEGAPALLVAALPYGNEADNTAGRTGEAVSPGGVIAPFARFNYYREAVKRLQAISGALRSLPGGEVPPALASADWRRKRHFRILCNSPIPEKPIAAAAGVGSPGRNALILTREAGSLFVIAAMTLPFNLASDTGEDGAGPFPRCSGCDAEKPPCVRACPTGALRGDGTLNRERCIQWYASGYGETVPEAVAAAWGNRLYGCTGCQDACVYNRRPIAGVKATLGPLPARMDTRRLLAASDGELRALFRDTAMGCAWLRPEAIRRSAELIENRRYLL
jgi:epoxyqueuosine reductase